LSLYEDYVLSKRLLRPYSVGDYVLDHGYADLGEYREQSATKA
jgi:hypothetical protein